MDDVSCCESAALPTLRVRFPGAAYRLLWGCSMLALGASVGSLGFTGMDPLLLLALLAGASSMWSG